MKFIKVYLTLLLFLLGTNVSLAALFDSPYEWVEDSQSDVEQVLKMMNRTNPKNSRDQVNFVRSFIIGNSSFPVIENRPPASRDEEVFDFYFTHPNETMAAILAHYDHKDKPKPPMECYSRTRLIMGLLSHFGITTRRIILFSDHGDTLTSHTLFEAYNPETQKWEVHDSNGDAYYISENKNEALSMEDILFSDLDKVTPCQAPGKCGWNLFPGLKETIAQYGIVLYDSSFEGKPDRIIINKDKFDLQKKFQAGQSFHSAKDRSPAPFMKIINDWWVSNGAPLIEERGGKAS